MTIIRSRQVALWLGLCVATAALASPGCNDAPTTAFVQNDFALSPDGAAPAGATTVFKAWWFTTLFARPVAPGESSESERTVPGSDFAYALIAPGWSPGSDLPPPRLVAVRSAQKLTATTHDLLDIAVSDQTFVGDCAAGSTLDAEDARLVVERIFPGDFAGGSYDPATCTTASSSPPEPSDGATPDDAAQTNDAGLSGG